MKIDIDLPTEYYWGRSQQGKIKKKTLQQRHLQKLHIAAV